MDSNINIKNVSSSTSHKKNCLYICTGIYETQLVWISRSLSHFCPCFAFWITNIIFADYYCVCASYQLAKWLKRVCISKHGWKDEHSVFPLLVMQKVLRYFYLIHMKLRFFMLFKNCLKSTLTLYEPFKRSH